MTHTGWRKPTQGSVLSERFAYLGKQFTISKSRAVVAVKKVAPAIGLKPLDILLLDMFSALSQPQDWEEGRQPIVWPSNNFLIKRLGVPLSTLRRHLRKLCELGVITIQDSPNGKRWGRRDDDGVIIEAYGFDLTPLAARAREFEALNAHLEEEWKLQDSLRNRITVTRRSIFAKIETALADKLRGPWKELQDEYKSLVKSLPKRTADAEELTTVLKWLKELSKRVITAFEAAFDWPKKSDAKSPQNETNLGVDTDTDSAKMAPKGTQNGTHIQTTTEIRNVACNCDEKREIADSGPDNTTDALAEVDDDINMNVEWSTNTRKRKSDIDIPVLMLSCPEFAEMARSVKPYINDWNDVHRVVTTLRPMVGISEDAWHIANRVLGSAVAMVAMVLVIDKFASGEVKSPGGYLRGLVQKARAGQLHLERSFFGRLSRIEKKAGASSSM